MTHDTARPTANAPVPKMGANTPALDADSCAALAADAGDEDAKLDIGVDETFPASDPPASMQPRSTTDEPPPSSGYRG